MALTFDHAIVAVPDLDAAEAGWRALGFTVTPRGRHKGWGTANACVMLANGYLELLAIRDTGQPLNGLDRFLADKPAGGAMGWAWSVPSLAAGEAAFDAAGVPVGTTRLSRWLDLPEGPVEPAFELVMPTVPQAFGVPIAFGCRHLTPHLTFQEKWARHPNGAVSLAALTVPAAAPDRAVAPLRGLGHPVTEDPTGEVETTLDGIVLRLTPSLASGEVVIAVADLAAVGADLHGRSVPVRHVGDALEASAPGLDRVILFQEERGQGAGGQDALDQKGGARD